MAPGKRLARSPFGPACDLDGMHWHQLCEPNGDLLPMAFRHEWSYAAGHPSGRDANRPHAHRWDEARIRAELAGQRPGAILYAVRRLAGRFLCGPSTAERPGDVTGWLNQEEAVSRTLHPELRPARLRDS